MAEQMEMQQAARTLVKEGVARYRSLLAQQIPFEDDDPTHFYEEAVIRSVSKREEGNVHFETSEKLRTTVGNNGDIAEDALRLLGFSMGIILNAHQCRNDDHRKAAVTQLDALVKDLTAKFSQTLEHYYHDRAAVHPAEVQAFSSEKIAATFESWEESEKPGSREFQEGHLHQLQAGLGAIAFEMDKKYRLRPAHYEKHMEVKAFIKGLCTKFESDLFKVVETSGSSRLDVIQDDMCTTAKAEFATWKTNPFPEDHVRHDDYINILVNRLSGIYKRVKGIVLEKEEKCAVKSTCEQVQNGLKQYCHQMKQRLASVTFLGDDDLEAEHDKRTKEALEMRHAACQCEAPHNPSHVKQLLLQKISIQYKDILTKNKGSRSYAHDKAAQAVDDSYDQFHHSVQEKLHAGIANEKLKVFIQTAMEEAKTLFWKKCPAQEYADFVRGYEELLLSRIDVAVDVLMDVLPMKRTEDEVLIAARWQDCQLLYQEEMGNRCRGRSHIPRDQLDKHHEEVWGSAVAQVQEAPMDQFQQRRWSRKVDNLYRKYKVENEMKRNCQISEIPAVGIHFGYNYCCVAILGTDGIVVIPNVREGNRERTPCYVAYHTDGTKTFGATAKGEAMQYPRWTLYDVKKIIGRKVDDVRRDIAHWPFIVERYGSVPRMLVDGMRLRPEQVLADFLRYIRAVVEQYLGRERGSPLKAVITVPSYFTAEQRVATENAVEMAGLRLLELVDESRAVAMAYALNWFDKLAKKVLVFDLGEDVLDVGVVEVKGINVYVLGVGRNTRLGGEDFDRELMEYCARVFLKEHGIDLKEGSNSIFLKNRAALSPQLIRLQAACEEAKKMLSSQSRSTVFVNALQDGKDLRVEITRAFFEELNQRQFQRVMTIVKEALTNSTVTKEYIQHIILVGGSTQIPKLREMLSQYFEGRATLIDSIHPETVVAYGAAIKAVLVNGEDLAKRDSPSLDDPPS